MLVNIFSKEVSDFVKEQRHLQRFSIRDLADACGTSVRSIVKIESGDPIRESTVIKVLAALGFEFEIVKQPKVKFNEIKTTDSKTK